MREQTRHTATLIASDVVAELAAQASDQFELMLDRTIETKRGWVFFYNSSEFINTGNVTAALAGNGPIFVARDGEVIRIPSHTSWQSWLSA
ncbi:MAG: YrhB domain-containing protein [Terricaulis sp.]